MFALRKSVSIAATSAIIGAAPSSSFEAPEHPTTFVVTEPSTFPPGDVSAHEEALNLKMELEKKHHDHIAVSIRINIFQETLYLYCHLDISLTCLGACQTFVERERQNLALLKQSLALVKQSNQLLARAESAEAKSVEEQERYAKQEEDHLDAIAVLQEQVDSLKEKNKELSASLKG